MATVSTVPQVLDAVLAAVNDDLTGVAAFESWPGPEAAPEMVVFGEITWDTYELASIKSGRQQRDETWQVEWEVYVFGTPGTVPANTKPVRDRSMAIAASLQDVLAESPGLGVGAGGWVQARLTAAGPRVWPESKAWAYRTAGNIHVNARLI